MSKYPFWPDLVFFEPSALEYPVGQNLYDLLVKSHVPVKKTGSHNRVTGLPGRNPEEAFHQAKKTLVVGVRRSEKFQTCRPSAHYQLPLATGCPGKCNYCYLHTNLGHKPYLRVYVNLDEIFLKARHYALERKPQITLFEGSAVSDPLFAEPYTNAVSRAIKYFAHEEHSMFRFVTKLDYVDTLLHIDHGGITRIRYSINTPRLIEKYEPGLPSLEKRLQAVKKLHQAGYPVGLMVAPIFLEAGWKEEYRNLFETVAAAGLEEAPHCLEKNYAARVEDMDITYEFITHRFTRRARESIEKVFPGCSLLEHMVEEERRFKYGQFGYGKYLYPKEIWEEGRDFFYALASSHFPRAKVEYFV